MSPSGKIRQRRYTSFRDVSPPLHSALPSFIPKSLLLQRRIVLLPRKMRALQLVGLPVRWPVASRRSMMAGSEPVRVVHVLSVPFHEFVGLPGDQESEDAGYGSGDRGDDGDLIAG